MNSSQNGGKLFKKADPLIDKLGVTEFNFGELVRGAQVYTDNPSASIIHTRLHTDNENSAVDNQVNKFNEELIDRKFRQAVIMPRNFTDDWINERQRKKKRSRLFDEEDEDGEMAEDVLNELGIKPEKSEEPSEDYGSGDGIEGSNSILSYSEDFESPSNIVNQESNPQQASLENLSEDPTDNSMKIVGEAIEKFARDFPVEEATKNNDHELPGSTASGSDTFTPLSPSESAVISPLRKEDVRKQHEKYLNELTAEAKALGYSEGFQAGEEKGLLQVKHVSNEALNTINKIADELENLKKEILLSATDNYFEICQALALAIFEKEISINPKQMFYLIQRAINQAIKSDSFTIKVNTEIFNSLSASEDQEFVGHLVKDSNLGQGEFKIETENTTIHGDLKQIIAEILQKMDLSLFDQSVQEQQAG